MTRRARRAKRGRGGSARVFPHAPRPRFARRARRLPQTFDRRKLLFNGILSWPSHWPASVGLLLGSRIPLSLVQLVKSRVPCGESTIVTDRDLARPRGGS